MTYHGRNAVFKTCLGRDIVLQHAWVGIQFYDIPRSQCAFNKGLFGVVINLYAFRRCQCDVKRNVQILDHIYNLKMQVHSLALGRHTRVYSPY